MLKKRYAMLLCLLSIVLELVFRNAKVSVLIGIVLIIILFYLIYPQKSNIICKIIHGAIVCFATVYTVEFIINCTIPQVSTIAFFFILQLCYCISLQLLVTSDEGNEYGDWNYRGAIICAIIQLLCKLNLFFVKCKYSIICEEAIYERLINYLIFDLFGGGIIFIISLYILNKFTTLNKLLVNVLIIPIVLINTEFFSLLYVILNMIFNFV